MFNIPLEGRILIVVPDTQQGLSLMKQNRLLLLCAGLIFVLCTTSCGGSGTGNGQKSGPAVANANWSQNEGVVFVDVDGKRIVDNKSLKSAGKFSEGLCCVVDKESGLLGFIDIKGNLVIPCQFEAPNHYDGLHGLTVRSREVFHNGYARVASSEANMLIDRKGKPVLEGFTALDWDGKVAIVCKGDVRQPGLVTMDGKEIIPLGTYRAMEFIGEGMIRVYGNNGGKGIIDAKGAVLIDNDQKSKNTNTPYSKVGEFVDGYVVVQTTNGDWMSMDKKGNVIVTLPKYNGNSLTFGGQMPKFSDGHIIYDNAVYYSSLSMVALFPPKGTNINSYAFVDGMASVYEGSLSEPKIGFANTDGKLVVPCLYSEKTDFSDGLAFVRDDTGWHIIDKTGTVTGSLQFEPEPRNNELGKFCAERALIQGKTVVDKTGSVVEMPGIVEISSFYYSGNDNSTLTDEL